MQTKRHALTGHDDLSVRDVLRDASAKQHAALDAAISEQSLSGRVGLGRYLLMNAYAFEVIEARLRDPGYSLLTARQAIAEDLDVLEIQPGTVEQPDQGALCPMGVAYVLGGASLGARVLHRRWKSAEDATVRQAGRFLRSEALSLIWRAFRTGAVRYERDLTVCTQSAISAFSIFSHSLDRASEELP